MSFLSAVFASEVRPMPSALDAQGHQQRADTQLTAAVSNVSTKVNLDVSQKVDPAKPGAQCLAQNLKAGAVAAQQDLRGQINAAFEDIAAAQAEIMAAVEAGGFEVEEIFPPQSFDETSVMGAMFSAAVAKATGGGTLSTFQEAAGKFTEVLDIAVDRQSEGPEAAMARIRDILIRASEAPVQTGFGHLESAEDPDSMRQTTVDWKAAFQDASPEQSIAMMKAIMSFNPNSPDPAFFSDLAEMVEADHLATDYIEKLENTIKTANEMGTPYYEAECVGHLVQLDGGFAPHLAVSETFNPVMSSAEIAAATSKATKDADTAEWKADREAELAELARRAAGPQIPTPPTAIAS